MNSPQEITPLTVQVEPNDVLRVLYIEDDEFYRESISENFRDIGIDVDVVASPSEAVEKVNARRYNLVVVDIQLNVRDISGDEFVHRNRDVLQGADTIALTGQRAEIKRKDVFTHIIDKGKEDEFFDHISEIFEEKKSEFAKRLSEAVKELSDGTKTIIDEYPISKEELKVLEEQLLEQLHKLESRDEKAIIYQGRRYSVNDLINEVQSGSLVGKAHVRMMLNLIHLEKS